MKLSRPIALFLLVCAALCAASISGFADELPQSQRVANAAIARWPDGRFVSAGAPWKWNDELGTLLEGMDAVWMDTADPRYFHYIQDCVDGLLGPDGSIPTYRMDEYQLDNILLGRQLLLLYRVTRKTEYLKAATQLYHASQDQQLQNQQLQNQPRTPAGTFRQSRRDPNQMGLEGLYMAEPFYAEYAAFSDHPEKFSDITHQFQVMEEHALDAKTGLLDHGRYMMALVDTLGYYPQNDPGRAQLLAILLRQAAIVAHDQDPASGLWRMAINSPNAKSDDQEPSAACMVAYALAKGARRGYLPEHYVANAQRAYHGILTHFVESGWGGAVQLAGGDKLAGGDNGAAGNPTGTGLFLLFSVEMENAQNAKLGRGDTVVVDGWFNSQQRTDAFGKVKYFHYKWKTEDEPGYSFFGHLFRLFGAQTTELDAEPTFANLKGTQVFVIASPDNLAKNPKAHFANAEDANQIARWVRAGGVLVIMENDTSFADLEHFNVISDKFGIHFNSILRKHVIGTQWDMGKFVIDGRGPIFHHPHTLYMKDVCTISVSGPAKPALAENGDIFMATAKYGKGTVYANVDPWLYNEYTDGRKLPVEYDNFAGGKELVRWVLEQVPHAR